MRTFIPLILCLLLSGCDDYEKQELDKAGDNISNATDHVGNASEHAAERARTGTADGLQDLSDDIRPDDEETPPEQAPANPPDDQED